MEKLVKRYEGEHVRLVPLVRGMNDERGVIAFVIWNAIEQAGDWERIFWDSPADPKKGDLFFFLEAMANSAAVMFEERQTNALAGLIWFNTFDPKDGSAHIHIWTDPVHRGAPTREMALIATDYAFIVLKLKRLIGISPYPVIRNLGLRCGYKEKDRQEVVDFNGMKRTLYRVEREFHG